MTIEDFLHFTSTMTIGDFPIQPLPTNIEHIDFYVQQYFQDNLNLFLLQCFLVLLLCYTYVVVEIHVSNGKNA